MNSEAFQEAFQRHCIILAAGCCGFLFSSAVPIAMIVVGIILSLSRVKRDSYFKRLELNTTLSLMDAQQQGE